MNRLRRERALGTIRAPAVALEPIGAHSSRFFKALLDPTRQGILLLLEAGDSNVGEIVSHFDLAQPTISRHLSVLKEANLVVGTREGQQVIYRLNREVLRCSMSAFFGQFRECRKVLVN